MKKIMYSLAVLGLSVLLVIAPSDGKPAMADGVIPYVPPGTPSPVNVLPSVLNGAKPAVSYAEYLALMTRQFAKDPRFWNAVGAMNAGTASPSQITLVQNEQGRFQVPATKPQQLVKVAGNALSALSSASLGMWMGDTFSRTVLGFDDGKVCQMNNGVLSTIAAFTNGVDCGAWQNELDNSYRNMDASAGYAGSPACRAVQGTLVGMKAGQCVAFIGVTTRIASGNTVYIRCWEVTTSIAGNTSYADFFSSTDGIDWGNIGGVTGSGTNADRCRAVYGAGGNPKLAYTYADPALGYPFPAWYKIGASSTGVQAVESTGDPDRTMKCTITLVGGGSVSGPATSPYKESDASYPVAECPELSEGQIPSGVQFWSSTPGKTDSKLSEQTVTPEYEEFRETFPQCSTGTCMLDLKGPDGVSCFAVQTGCVSWFEDPAKDENFTCSYGGTPVPLSECSLYAPTFKPQNQQTGHVYGDPETGASVDSQTALAQETGSGAWPGTVQDPTETRACFPTGWAILNPVEWVLRPVTCALEWAFVPRADVVTDTGTGIQEAVEGSILGNSAQIVNSMVAPFDVASATCQGPPFRVNIDFGGGDGMDETYYPLSACDAPMSTVAALFNAVTQGIILLLSLTAAIRYFASIFGFVGYGSLNAADGGSSVKFRPGRDS